MQLSKCLVVLVVALAVTGGVSAAAKPKTPKTVAELVIANEKNGFSILLAAVKAADPSILAALSNPALSLTVFAPNDAAFEKLIKAMETTPEKLLADKETLNRVLSYHVLANTKKPLMASSVLAIKRVKAFPTLLGKDKVGSFAIRVNGNSVRITTSSGGVAKLVATDLKAGGSVVHVIDSVLVPGSPKK